MPSPCPHTALQLTPSPFAPLAGYKRPSPRHLEAAESSDGRIPPIKSKTEVENKAEKLESTFPAPLVLPWDELNLDPECPGQTFKEWRDAGRKGGNSEDEYRNRVPGERKLIYVACVIAEDQCATMKRRKTGRTTNDAKSTRKRDVQTRNQRTPTNRKGLAKANAKANAEEDDRPETRSTLKMATILPDLMAYLRAFYHGMPLKQLSTHLRLAPQTNTSLLTYEGLEMDIRTRTSPDDLFPIQLNLADICDLAIAILPPDAYALVLLTNYDMYEDEEDDFCCGRAYGGSRVAVVSSARYNPLLDAKVVGGIDYLHVWPASHCREYVERACGEEDEELKKQFAKEKRSRTRKSARDGQGDELNGLDNGPIRKAIAAVSGSAYGAYSPLDDPKATYALWFSRICRTVSHELGHCFGIAHCVYYACSMQGTAGMAEDVRQPPYLCPVCLKKVSHALWCEMQGGKEVDREVYVKERYETLLQFCESIVNERGFGGQGTDMFEGFATWLRARLGSMYK